MSEEEYQDEQKDYPFDQLLDEEDSDNVSIQLKEDLIVSIDIFNLYKWSRLIRRQYQKKDISLLSNDLQQIQEKYSLEPENIIAFFECINNQNAQISKKRYFDFLRLSKIFEVPKFKVALNNYANDHLNDINFVIKKIKWQQLSQIDEIDEIEPELEKILYDKVEYCLHNPEFGDLPITIIYNVIKNSQKPVHSDLIYDFIMKSLDKRYSLFSFIKIRDLSDQKLTELCDLLSSTDKESSDMYQQYLQTDLQYIKSIKESIDLYKKFSSVICPILCQIPIEILPSFQQNNNSFVFSKIDKNGPGLLCIIKQKENDLNQGKPLFFVSQSSNDIYNVIDKSIDDGFSIYNKDYYIEFQLPIEVSICGFRITSYKYYYPKKFEIEIDDMNVYSTNEAEELHGSFKEMTININPRNGRKVKFINKGENWVDSANYINLGKFEILSNDERYSNGVFETLIKSSKSKDPHKCGVLNFASFYDFNSFYSIENKQHICTYSDKKLWFQIELINGLAILTGFRLNRSNRFKMKNYKIIGTDDCEKPINLWSTLIEINEQQENEHELLDIYEFDNPSPLIKFIRIVQIGETWEHITYMTFYHLDFFGYYFNLK